MEKGATNMAARYDRSMIRQIEELTVENETLRRENKELRGENRALRVENARLQNKVETLGEKLNGLEATIEERIQQAVERAVANAVQPLTAKIEEKDREIQRLKGRLSKNSSNSSRPPGSDGFAKIPNNREAGDKKRGGQPGHKGHTVTMPKNLEELVQKGMAEHIVRTDVEEGGPYVSDWTIDMKAVLVYTERRRRAGAPPTIAYGPRLKAAAVYLNVVGMVAYQRLSDFFREVSHGHLRVSKASLEGFVRSAAKAIRLDGPIEELLNGTVVHVDETPTRTAERPKKEGNGLETAKGTTYSSHIRTYSNKTTIVLTAAPYKTEESVRKDGILTRFHGIVSQDHEAKFYKFGDRHATCGVHLLRELKGLDDLYGLSWARDARQFFIEMNKQKKEDVSRGQSSRGRDLLCRCEARYEELVEQGKRLLERGQKKTFGHVELRRMVARLEDYKDSYLLFMRDYGAPFTNNEAERDLRHCKTKQKVSGCFRSWDGVLTYCKIRSLLATSKKRGINLLDSLSLLWTKQSIPAEPMSLS